MRSAAAPQRATASRTEGLSCAVMKTTGTVEPDGAQLARELDAGLSRQAHVEDVAVEAGDRPAGEQGLRGVEDQRANGRPRSARARMA